LSGVLPCQCAVDHAREVAAMPTEAPAQSQFENASVPEDTARAVADRDDGKCQVCGDNLFEFHHVQFRSRGGSDEPENVLSLCKEHHDAVHAEEIRVVDFNPGEDVLTVVSVDTGELVEPLWFYDRPSRGADEAHLIYTRIRDLRDSETRHRLRIGEDLCRLEDGDLWSSLDVEGLGEFIGQPEIDIARQTAYRYMKVVRRLIWEAGLDRDEVAEMGVRKAGMICQFVGDEDFDEWVERAKALSRSDLRELINEENDEGGPIDESDETGEPEHVTRLQHLLNRLRDEPWSENILKNIKNWAEDTLQEARNR
jgi:hypothetical protein